MNLCFMCRSWFFLGTLLLAQNLLACSLVAAIPRCRLALVRAVVCAFALRAALHILAIKISTVLWSSVQYPHMLHTTVQYCTVQ